MSGIAGIFNRDGRPVEAHELERLRETMAYRGPDGSGQWNEGSIGLVHLLLHTTPESLHERLPLCLDDLAITADARLDNRDELFPALGIPPERQSAIPDSELILRAYQRWGADCVLHLLGDFAFAIWDGREQRLFCARDHFGLKPFYYMDTPQRFLFATNTQAIIALLPQRPPVREQAIIDRLILDYRDKSGTFFEGISRLPPAHTLIVRRDGSPQLYEYWRLDPQREIELGSMDDYAERCRELFLEAVRCRVRSAFPVGAMLSGGLDSSSVACAARDVIRQQNPNAPPLHTFSGAMPDVPESDEREFQDYVIRAGGFEPHFFRADQVGPLYDLDRRLRYMDRPIDGGNDFLDWGLFAIAEQQGVRVMLNGFDGDNTVSHGDALVREWVVSREWGAIRQEITDIAALFGSTEKQARAPLFNSHILPTLQILARNGDRVGAVRRLVEVERYFGYPRTATLKDAVHVLFPRTTGRLLHLRHHRRLPPEYRQIFSTSAIERYGFRSDNIPMDAVRDSVHLRDQHYRRLTASFLTRAIEDSEAKGAAFHLDVRSPFCDIRLMEFCLAMPSRYKMYRGMPRAALRAAMKGILPEEIRTRLSKGNLQQNFYRGLTQQDADKVAEVRKHIETLMPYIDANYFRFTLDSYLQRSNIDQELYLWHVISIGSWLLRLQ